MNTAIEDYLKLIYEFEYDNENTFVKSAKLADYLGYTIQSVNEMIKKMARLNLVIYQPYKGVQLTNKGNKEALRMVRAHRIWEVFLSSKLGLSWEALHDEAERLEHATSLDVIDKLYDYLGQPKYCNHGNPIPNQYGEIPQIYKESLHSKNVGDQFIIKRVIDYKPLLNYLNKMGFALNDKLKVIDKDSFSKTITVLVNNNKITISKNVSEMIFGESSK